MLMFKCAKLGGYLMRRWGKALVALAVLSSVFLFSALHSSAKTNDNSQSNFSSYGNPKLQAKEHPHAAPTIQDKKVETKYITQAQVIPFQTVTQKDLGMEQGSSKIITQGVNGSKNTTYKVTYVDGLETAREIISDVVTAQPVNQVIKVGAQVANMHSPQAGPAGASALCSDGMLSYSQNRQGACSKHGGVSLWYQ
jgi:hypothetical protein